MPAIISKKIKSNFFVSFVCICVLLDKTHTKLLQIKIIKGARAQKVGLKRTYLKI